MQTEAAAVNGGWRANAASPLLGATAPGTPAPAEDAAPGLRPRGSSRPEGLQGRRPPAEGAGCEPPSVPPASPATPPPRVSPKGQRSCPRATSCCQRRALRAGDKTDFLMPLSLGNGTCLGEERSPRGSSPPPWAPRPPARPSRPEGPGPGAPHHGLEAGVQLCEEGRLPGQREHALLHHRALHVVVLDHHVLLQDLDGVQLVRALPLREHDLGETAGRGRASPRPASAGPRPAPRH